MRGGELTLSTSCALPWLDSAGFGPDDGLGPPVPGEGLVEAAARGRGLRNGDLALPGSRGLDIPTAFTGC